MRFRKKGWVLNSSIWRAVLSLFYPPVIIQGKNGKNSESPVGSNKSEKRKPKSAVYRSILASVVYFHIRLISTRRHKREMTRNRFVLNRARGFESHHLRQKSQIQTNLRLFYFALLLLGTQKHRQKPGRRCPFSPKFSPTGTLTGRLLNLLKILLFVETAVSLHPLEYVTSAADTISVPNGGRECKDVTPEPCCRVRIR